MAWTNPKTWNVGDVPSVAEQNQYIRDNLIWVVRPADLKSTQKDVTGATPIDLLNGEITIPAGSMGTKGCVRGFLMGDYVNGSSGTTSFTLSATFGGITFYTDTSNNAITASAIHRDWFMQIWIANVNSATSQFCACQFNWTTSGAALTGIGDLASTSPGGGAHWHLPFGSDGNIAANTAVDCTVTVPINMPGADPTKIMSLKYAVFELVGQAA